MIHDVNINITPTTITLSSPTTTTTLTGAIRGSVYTIQVQPSNTLGTGNITSTTVGMFRISGFAISIMQVLKSR